MKNRIETVIIFLCAFIICMLFQGSVIAEDMLDWRKYEDRESAVTIGELIDGTEIEQVIPIKGKKVTEVGFSCATYGERKNTGKINIDIYGEDGEKLAENILEMSEIEDNELVFISLDKPASGKTVTLKIKASGGKKNESITLWTAINNKMKAEGGMLSVNNIDKNEQLEIVLYFRTVAWGKLFLALANSILIVFFWKKC